VIWSDLQYAKVQHKRAYKSFKGLSLQVQSEPYKQSLLGTIMLSALRYDTPSSSGEQTFWDEPAQVGREQIKICREEAQQQGLPL